MRKVIFAAAAVAALSFGSAQAQDVVQTATDAVNDAVAAITPPNQETTVAIGVVAGFVLASAPVTVPAVVGAVAGGFVGYYWYQWYTTE